MKVSVLGVLAIFSVALVTYATANVYYPQHGYNMGYYQQQNQRGFSSFGQGGLFEMIIFLFVFVLMIQLLFGSTLGGGGGSGGGGHGGGGSGYGSSNKGGSYNDY